MEVEFQDEKVLDSRIKSAQEKRGIKRKATDKPSLQDSVSNLAAFIVQILEAVGEDDHLLKCGAACLAILETRPEVVLELARQSLHTWPYKDVPACWRRMFEESSLWMTVRVLQAEAEQAGTEQRQHAEVCKDPDWLTQVVKLLDTAIQLTGAPGRSELVHTIMKELEVLTPDETDSDIPIQLAIAPPDELQTNRPIFLHSSRPSFEAFQAHLDRSNTPLILKGAVEHWPARAHWISPAYWMKRTLGGRRLVPVEIGSQYTDSAWSQRILPFKEFLTTYMLRGPEDTKTGYLAQYDLFAQIPALRSDVQVPDYCYCSPPQPTVTSTNGKVEEQEVAEPLMNLWLGPAGTKTPLHTDPYSNILVQVMGYKYVRLYAPRETEKLCPMGIDENGVDMSNTSSVDVSLARLQDVTDGAEAKKTMEQEHRYPLFDEAEFVEAILGPGECMYIPQGWWHYVEGLTIGASVSFWWN